MATSNKGEYQFNTFQIDYFRRIARRLFLNEINPFDFGGFLLSLCALWYPKRTFAIDALFDEECVSMYFCLVLPVFIASLSGVLVFDDFK